MTNKQGKKVSVYEQMSELADKTAKAVWKYHHDRIDKALFEMYAGVVPKQKGKK